MKNPPIDGWIFDYSAGVSVASVVGSAGASVGSGASTGSAGISSFGWFLRSLSACFGAADFLDAVLTHFGNLMPFLDNMKATRVDG